MRKLFAVLTSVVVLAMPVAASAQASSVSLDASARTIAFGAEVKFSGAITPAAGGETVELLDDSNAVLATATTKPGGAYSFRHAPQATTTYRASWSGVVSDPVKVSVRAIVSASMSPVRLFDRVTVRGTVRPARPGRRVQVALLVGGRVAERSRARIGSAGGYRATFRVPSPGIYRARATFDTPDLLRGRDVSAADATPLPRLRAGSRGRYVRLLERRLGELHYRLTRDGDGRFDQRTGDAVIAFHKVQRMRRASNVDAATWRALADPRPARARVDRRGFHFEVDQSRQVLMTVEDGEVTNVLHVSTGKASTPTRDGRFRVNRKIAGYSPNRLYYPSYFDGNRALHGWPEVPTHPASHGCVRIPYWNALWVYGLADFGTRVIVYH